MAEPVAKKGEDEKKQFIESMKSLLGEKNNVWFGTDGKIMVQVNAADWTAARKLLDQYFKNANTAGDVKALREVRKQMPPRTSVLGLIDAVSLFGKAAEAFKPLLGAQLPAGWPQMPPKGTAGYIGLAVTLQPNRGSFDLFLSADATQEFFKAFIKPLMPE
jgi:hypothetical protein